jgi:hypothetical protein
MTCISVAYFRIFNKIKILEVKVPPIYWTLTVICIKKFDCVWIDVSKNMCNLSFIFFFALMLHVLPSILNLVWKKCVMVK